VGKFKISRVMVTANVDKVTDEG